MFSVVWFCVVLPLASGQFSNVSRVALSVAFVLLAFHPVCMVGHYRLFSSHGRHVYTEAGKDFPYCTAPELVVMIIAVFFAIAVGLFAWRY